MSTNKILNGDINRNTYQLLFSNINSNEIPKDENNYIFNAIETFTKIEEKKLFGKLLKILLEMQFKDLNKITYNKETKEYEYRDNCFVISFDKISNYMYDRKELKKELLSNARYGKCHYYAQTEAPTIKDSRIVTGYMIRGESKFLHSVIEVPKEDKIMVFDYTKNLCMEKEQYNALYHFQELSSFEGKKVIDDIEKIVGNIDIVVRPYLIFRDEIMRDMERNPQIFLPTEEGKSLTQGFREVDNDNLFDEVKVKKRKNDK